MLFQVSRPDGKTESLGLSVLDEPCAKQSDRTVLDLQIRAVSKQTAVKPMVRIYTQILCKLLRTSVLSKQNLTHGLGRVCKAFGFSIIHHPHIKENSVLKTCLVQYRCSVFWGEH